MKLQQQISKQKQGTQFRKGNGESDNQNGASANTAETKKFLGRSFPPSPPVILKLHQESQMAFVTELLVLIT